VGFEPTVPLPGQLLSRQPDSAALAPLRKSVRHFIMPRTGLEPVQAFTHKPLKLACLPIPPPRHPKLYILWVESIIYCFESVLSGGFSWPDSFFWVSGVVFSWEVPGSEVESAGLPVFCCCSFVSPV
jgi:hypothetical protein